MLTSYKTHNWNILSHYYEYDAIAAIVYNNSQSILVNFPINIEVFLAQRFLAGATFTLPISNVRTTCDIGTHDLPDMYTLGPVVLRIWAYISGK